MKYTIVICTLFLLQQKQLSAQTKQPTLSQLNEQLKIICDSIKTIDDNTDSNYSHLSRSREYQMTIMSDTLSIQVKSRDKLVGSNDPRDDRFSNDVYKMNIHDIGAINFISNSHDNYGYKWTEYLLEFISLRYYPLFNRKADSGTIIKDEAFTFQVINQSDTIFFKELVHLLNENIDVQNNYIEPNCETLEITLNGGAARKMEIIEFDNLELPILLNENQDLEKEIHRILIDYIVQENIKKVYGSIVINSNNQFEYFDSYQNQMYNHLNSLDTVPAGYRVMRETAYLKITDEQNDNLTKLLKNQSWQTGSCKGNLVNSYFSFLVENEKFRDN